MWVLYQRVNSRSQNKSFFQRSIFIGISYFHLLLHDMMLCDDSHRTGTADCPPCECGFERESAEHFLLCCIRFQDARNMLNDTVNEIFWLISMSDIRESTVGIDEYRCYKEWRQGYKGSTFPVYFWNSSRALVLPSHWQTFVMIQARFLIVHWDLFLQGCYTVQKFSLQFYTVFYFLFLSLSWKVA